jgi:hypothetical protein
VRRAPIEFGTHVVPIRNAVAAQHNCVLEPIAVATA